ncbi:hypothetical protein D3C87_1296190 [compost metagenome]
MIDIGVDCSAFFYFLCVLRGELGSLCDQVVERAISAVVFFDCLESLPKCDAPIFLCGGYVEGDVLTLAVPKPKTIAHDLV